MFRPSCWPSAPQSGFRSRRCASLPPSSTPSSVFSHSPDIRGWACRGPQHVARERIGSELRVDTYCEYRYGTAVGVVARVFDELIIKGQVELRQKPQVVIGLENLLGSGVRQSTIPDEDAQAPGVQVLLTRGRDAAIDDREAHRVMGASQMRSLQ